MHSYHLLLHPALHENDFDNHMTFSFSAENQLRIGSFFQNEIRWSATTFKSNGSVNLHNVHY